jgi:hypothetical protein
MTRASPSDVVQERQRLLPGADNLQARQRLFGHRNLHAVSTNPQMAAGRARSSYRSLLCRRSSLTNEVSTVLKRPNGFLVALAAPCACTYRPGKPSSPGTGRICHSVRPAFLDHTLGRSRRGYRYSL